jgi:3-oxoadipate enol-lactonase
VIRYDRRGYGRSPEAKASYSQVDDLQAVMRAAGVDRAVIVGSSNGGGVAVDFTLAHPDEVDRLVLVGPEVSGISHSRYFVERGTELLMRMAQGDAKGAMKASWLFAPGDDSNLEKALKKADLRIAFRQDLARPAPPAAPRLGEIKVPTLVLIGEYDASDNQSEAGGVEYAIKGASRVIVRGAGHLIYLEEPAAFTDSVTRFALAVPSRGTEAALRRAIEGFQAGAPDYAQFSPAMARAVRANLEQIKASQTALGPLRTLAFRRTTTDGDDLFLATYEKGSGGVRIMLGPDGKISDLRPSPID